MRHWIYILHFDQKHYHAAHYIGTSKDVPARMERHRKGEGARLTQVLKELGIGFTIGAIAEVKDEGTAFDIERKLKRQKHSQRYCELCQGAAAWKIPGTTPIQREEFIKWLEAHCQPTNSEGEHGDGV